MNLNKTPFLLVFLLTACASSPAFHGNSIANEKLKSDALNSILKISSAEMQCKSIKEVKVESSEVVKLEKYKLPDGAIENWSINGCGKSTTYQIVFSPSLVNKGSYSYTISKPPKSEDNNGWVPPSLRP